MLRISKVMIRANRPHVLRLVTVTILRESFCFIWPRCSTAVRAHMDGRTNVQTTYGRAYDHDDIQTHA